MGVPAVPRELTVVVFAWTNGWRDVGGPEQVHAVKRMVAANLTIPHRFVCITDRPDGITECETFPCWNDPIVTEQPTRHGSWRRLKLFSFWAAQQFPGWVLNIDLDVVVAGSIDPLITWEDLRILQGSVSRYRGGLWLHRTGTRTHVWDSFDPDTSPFEIGKYTTRGRPWVGSDQGWISVQCPAERMYRPRDGVYCWGGKLARSGKIPANARIIFPMGDVKPWHEEAKRTMPALAKEYARWI